MVLSPLKRLTKALAVGTMCALSSQCSATPKERPESSILILHTNDSHGHLRPWRSVTSEGSGKTSGGMARLATVVRKARSEYGDDRVLLLDAGDTLTDTPISMRSRGGLGLSLMNQLGYDAMVPGNHEYDYGVDRLLELSGAAHFPFLAANLRRRSNSSNIFPAYRMVTRAGVRIGIIGLTYPNTPLTSTPKNVENLEFAPSPVTAVHRTLERLRGENVDFVLVLSHLGLSADIQLAENVKGIDLIIGGHSHNRIDPPIIRGKTTIVQAGAHLSDVGEIRLAVSGDKVRDIQSRLHPLDDSIDEDPGIRNMLESHEASERTLACAVTPILRAQTLAGPEPRTRSQESPADSLFADLLREVLNVDIVLLPGLGYGTPIPAGAIQESELRNLIPHDSKMVTMELQGQSVLSILEQSLENFLAKAPGTKVGGMIQVSGLSFSYIPDYAPGKRIQDISIAGKPLQTRAIYRVATNEMLAQGGHAYHAFLDAMNRSTSSSTEYELVANAIRAKNSVTVPRSGRIRTLENPR